MAKKAVSKRGRKKGGPNRSEEIRKHLAVHPSDKPAAVAKALAAKGIKVSPALISNVATRAAGGSKGGKRGRRPGRKSQSASNGLINLNQLVMAAQFIKSCGTAGEARRLLDAAEKVIG